MTPLYGRQQGKSWAWRILAEELRAAGHLVVERDGAYLIKFLPPRAGVSRAASAQEAGGAPAGR